MESLLLFRRALSSPTMCRFIPALSVPLSPISVCPAFSLLSPAFSNNETPGSVYQPSTKMFPRAVAEYVYPNGFVTRRVNNSGDISWHNDRVFISEVFRFEELGLEEVEDRFYEVFFREVEIGEFDVEALRFRPVRILR
jgi:hypothetical protein